MTSLADIKVPLMIYDGHCVFCNRAVKYIIRKDSQEQIKFLPSQRISELGLDLGPKIVSDSVMLIWQGQIYTSSDAVIRAWMILGNSGLKSLLLYVPRFIRDGLYRIIALKRYKWFGSYDDCPLLPPTRYFS